MNIQQWLRQSTELLKKASVPSAQLDAEIILADMLNKDRSWLHANEEVSLDLSVIDLIDGQLLRRKSHEPLAYIRGKQEFYGRDFIVSADTLTPRPETETMVEMALELLKKESITSVADIGTGSGCIIISTQLESQSAATYTGYDISEQALKIARQNAVTLQSSAMFEHCNILDTRKQEWQSAELILANLPYVPDGYNINKAATHEPEMALFAGKDGLDFYRALFRKARKETKYIVTESLLFQHVGLASIAQEAGFSIENSRELIQTYIKA